MGLIRSEQIDGTIAHADAESGARSLDDDAEIRAEREAAVFEAEGRSRRWRDQRLKGRESPRWPHARALRSGWSDRHRPRRCAGARGGARGTMRDRRRYT